MNGNTELWDRLGKTDPAHTKSFKRAGGFAGTAVKPMWSYRRMTEEFGPCGKGWGIGEPSFQVVPGPEGEQLVYCTASIWYHARDDSAPHTVYGVGGDKAVGKNKYGLTSDDEAFKKAFTDAITNALKMIGVGADVHMGMFDDSKYVNTVRQEYAAANTVQDPADPPAKSSAALKREDAWGKAMEDLQSDFMDCHSLAGLASLRESYRERARAEGWNRTFMASLAEEFAKQEEALQRAAYLEAGE